MEEQQNERWSEYFEDLLNEPEPDTPQSPVTSSTNRHVNFNSNPPSMNEVKSAIKQMKNGKAAGADEIPAEFLKASIEVDSFATQLHSTITGVANGRHPIGLDRLIIKIPKKGDLSICQNWRGNTLLNAVNKLICFS